MIAEIKADEETLEALIDKMGISIFLQTIAYVCAQKSDHIDTNWQDAHLAKNWEKVATKIEDAAVIALGL